MPPPMPALGGRGMMQGMQTVTLPMPPGSAVQVAMAAIGSNKGEVVGQTPSSLSFRLKLPWWGGRLTGTMDIMPAGTSQTTLTVLLRPDYGSLVPLAAGGLIAFLLPVFINPYGAVFFSPMLMFLLLGASLAYTGYNLGGPALEKKRAALLNALYAQGGAPPGPAVAAPHGAFAAPPAAGFARPPAAAPPGVAAATPFEQLRKLGELRDSGKISAADFEKAKADILGRIR